MKDSERIGNLEELMAESLIRLDRLDDGQQRLEVKLGSLGGKMGSLDRRMGSLEGNMLKLSENQFMLNDRQSGLEESMSTLIQVVRKNSVDIEDIKDQMTGMSTKEGLNNLFEAMMNGFDRVDKRFDFMQGEIDMLKAKVSN